MHEHNDDCYKNGFGYAVLICGFPMVKYPATVNLLPEGFKIDYTESGKPAVVRKRFHSDTIPAQA